MMKVHEHDIYFLLPSPSHGLPSFLGFENLFVIYIYNISNND